MLSPEQVRPLAPATERLRSDHDESALRQQKTRRRRCLKICGCISAIVLLTIIILIVILIFTVFRVKDPVIKMNNITVTQLELINNTIPRPGVNMSLIADVSVKNPNYASFKFKNTTTTLYYHGLVIGEARGPPGQSKARRTARMNITVDIIPDRLLSAPNFTQEISSRVLDLNTYSRIPGRVKILAIIKRRIMVKMNCTLSFNLTSLDISDQKCKQDVDL
ncbi:hypothetical protein HS088_TW08G01003 [Tripterygium wilfordii]|uniref:Late embryogenesis abundant protein LEA-2 subgroup domain-containing protein n=1 Tax=Tripterygium wilfordii TaxID=458696 RepID=A0A7J7DDR7_TRIWF|nr:late embryogenesis abundant protein At1g64065-like [Tripterygium wilfordii]KAF5744398.1 hypothetical protein HS088_TW08G01003 [Tripterygium wilfordii]